MTTYKEYYDHCKSVYEGEYIGLLPLEDLSLHTYLPDDPSFPWPEDYKNKVAKIHDYCKSKINSKEGLFDPSHKNIIKVNDYYGSNEIYELGNFFCDYLEKNVYGCHSIVEAILIYQSLPNKIERSSWIWHYDDDAPQQLKLMVYLNDVEEDTGAFEVLKSPEGQGLVIESSKISPETNSSQVYKGSRIPEKALEELKGRGFKQSSITGPAGTFCLFDPNCIHRATTPKKKPYRLCVVYNFRPYHKNEVNKVSKGFTKTWNNLANIKSFSTTHK